MLCIKSFRDGAVAATARIPIGACKRYAQFTIDALNRVRRFMQSVVYLKLRRTGIDREEGLIMFAMLNHIISREARKRWSLLATTAEITLRPSKFADRLEQQGVSSVRPAFRFMLLSVGSVLMLEVLFSVVFNTTFSDLIHHSFAILVVVTGGIAIFCVLKGMFTRNVDFKPTVQAELYVGCAALFVMMMLIFAVVSIDFATNYKSVINSGCSPRTLMCLLSGNTQTEYGLLQDVGTPETQGWSFAYVVWIILICLVFYIGVLSTVFKKLMGVARWRTIFSAFVAVVTLSPFYLVLLNAIYRWFYELA